MASNSLTGEGWIRRLQRVTVLSFNCRAICLGSKQRSSTSVGRQRGFTLIELMIVIVVIGILAAIAYPSYLEQIRKTRRSDGKAALLQTAQQLERCYTEFNRYNMPGSGGTPACPALDVAGTALASPYDQSETVAKVGGVNKGYYAISVTGLNTSSTSFTLLATPQLAQTADSSTTESNRCGVLTYNYQGIKGVKAGTGTLTAERCW